VTGTVVGVLVAPPPEVAHQLGLDVAFPAFFLTLAIDEARGSRRALLAGLLGAGVAAGLLLVTDPGNALLGAALATLVGAAPERAGRGRSEEGT
jgi:predicted branched-subunit amino acid permease